MDEIKGTDWSFVNWTPAMLAVEQAARQQALWRIGALQREGSFAAQMGLPGGRLPGARQPPDAPFRS